MRTLTLRTREIRPQEPRPQAKPRLVDVLKNRQPLSSGRYRQGRVPKAYLSHRSMHGRYYYTKMRIARGRGAKDAIAAAIGMRWNYYLSHGKHTPHFVPHERHTVAISSGLMSEIRHSGTANHGHVEAQAHTHHAGFHAPTLTMQNVSNSAACFQNVQLVHATNPHAQRAAGEGNQLHAAFSFPVHSPANAGAAAGGEPAVRMRRSTETGSPGPAPKPHHANALHFSEYSGTIRAPSSPATTQATGNTATGATSAGGKQMDITLTIAYDPMSQLSYRPTYQVGTYNATQATAQIVPAAISFTPQYDTAAPQVGTATNFQRREIGYFGSTRKKLVALKVAQAADAVPE